MLDMNETRIEQVGGTVYFSGVIDDGAAHRLSVALHAAQEARPREQEHVLLEINSPGGVVDESFACASVVKEFGNIVTLGRGLVSSGACAVFLVGAVRILDRNCRVLIHQHRGGYAGYTHAEREHMTTVSKDMHKRIRKFYMKHMGQPKEVIERLLSNESYMYASAAKKLGFADKLIG